jgi:hypothetical protein
MNTYLLSAGIQLGKFDTVKLTLLTCFIDLETDDFKKVIRFKDKDWDNYNEYCNQDITSNLEQNELFDKMKQLD